MRLFHYSEDPTIEVFEVEEGGVVWAVDEGRAHTYWFPRQCPRVTFWPPLVHAIEWAWLDAMRTTKLYAYEFDPAGFEPEGAFWTSGRSVRPIAVEPVGDLFGKHADAGIELRLVADLRPLAEEVAQPGAVGDFSIIRLRNAGMTPAAIAAGAWSEGTA